MYSATLLAHSWLRWAVIVTGLIAVLGGIIGVVRKGQWTPADDRAGMWFIITLDLQVLLGLVMYFFLSPITSTALRNFGPVMADSAQRYWAVEHPFGILVGLTLAHIGRARTRRLPTGRRHRTAMIFYSLAILAILASVPWPFMPAGRPFIRLQ